MNNFEKSKLIKYIGYFEIIGGFLGIILIMISYFSDSFDGFNFTKIVLLLIIFLMFVFVVISGGLILQEKSLGVKFSIISQFFQLFSFQIATLKYEFVCGMKLFLGFASGTIGLDYYLGSNFSLKLSNFGNDSQFSINLVATLLLYWLWKLDHDK